MKTVSPFRHLMANVYWSDDPAGASLFNWDELAEWNAFVPLNGNPRYYTEEHNGSGLLFVAAQNPSDGLYYVVGFFSDVALDPKHWGWFTCNLEQSVRFAAPIPLDVEQHCPELPDGRPRTKTFGLNNFNCIRDEWAIRMLEDALHSQPDEEEDWPGCTATGESPRRVIWRVLNKRFGINPTWAASQ